MNTGSDFHKFMRATMIEMVMIMTIIVVSKKFGVMLTVLAPFAIAVAKAMHMSGSYTRLRPKKIARLNPFAD